MGDGSGRRCRLPALPSWPDRVLPSAYIHYATASKADTNTQATSTGTTSRPHSFPTVTGAFFFLSTNHK